MLGLRVSTWLLGGGGTSVAFSMVEGSGLEAGTIVESGATFFLSAGATIFSLNTTTGALSFKTAPAAGVYKATIVSSTDKRYKVTVTVRASSVSALMFGTVLMFDTVLSNN